MDFHNGFADGQAKAAAAVGTGARFVGAVKAFKDMRQIFSRYTRSAIGDNQNCITPCAVDADANLAMWLVVVDSVGEKVGNDLAQKVGVPKNFKPARDLSEFRCRHPWRAN